MPRTKKDVGWLVVMGSRKDEKALALIRWMPDETLSAIVGQVQNAFQGDFQIIGKRQATPIEVASFEKKHREGWRFGYMFYRTKALNADIAAMEEAATVAIAAILREMIESDRAEKSKRVASPRLLTRRPRKPATNKKSAQSRRKAA